ncbi:MAG: transglutaminase domain-containing protein, partial [Pirellulaceae bacterium]|nr:transglutaminase domain-containing protein [Pirellulaceae bacterium]
IAEVLVRAGENAAQLTKALAGVTAREREGLEFLLIHMPDHDLRKLTADFLIENVHEAYVTLDAAPWKDSIPKEIFFNNVLPYSSINERRDNWRKDFRQRFSPLIAEAKTAAQAAALLNQRLYPLVKVKYSTQRKKADQSPYESINSGLASCTGLSVLLIDACRAVGVPARFVGTPLWSDGSGTHSWLEVWDNGWHFTGAAEPNGDDLDKAWFLDRAAAAQRDVPKHAIYAVSYARTPLKFPMVWARDADYIYAVNITDRYVNLAVKPPAGSMKVMIRVRDQLTGQRVPAKLMITMDGSDQPAHSMVANDEGFDANDHIGLIVPVGKKLRIEATLDERTKAMEVVADPAAPLVNISL